MKYFGKRQAAFFPLLTWIMPYRFSRNFFAIVFLLAWTDSSSAHYSGKQGSFSSNFGSQELDFRLREIGNWVCKKGKKYNPQY